MDDFLIESLMLLKNKSLMLLKVKIFVFENNTLKKVMLNIKRTETTQNDLYFGLIFLTCRLVDSVLNSRESTKFT